MVVSFFIISINRRLFLIAFQVLLPVSKSA